MQLIVLAVELGFKKKVGVTLWSADVDFTGAGSVKQI
jgi:hypothetical protein